MISSLRLLTILLLLNFTLNVNAQEDKKLTKKEAHDKMSGNYNKRLSQRRAQSVVDYLTKKGIAKSRLVAKGCGEDKPVATNDTEEGRQLNRRTEFKVLESK